MFDSRQRQQWNIESNWWDTSEGKKWLASQNIAHTADFWNQFGAAHKYWTFEEICKHIKNKEELIKNEPKNARGTKDPKKMSTKTKHEARKDNPKAQPECMATLTETCCDKIRRSRGRKIRAR